MHLKHVLHHCAPHSLITGWLLTMKWWTLITSEEQSESHFHENSYVRLMKQDPTTDIRFSWRKASPFMQACLNFPGCKDFKVPFPKHFITIDRKHSSQQATELKTKLKSIKTVVHCSFVWFCLESISKQKGNYHKWTKAFFNSFIKYCAEDKKISLFQEINILEAYPVLFSYPIEIFFLFSSRTGALHPYW
jgi:hypothetical protein